MMSGLISKALGRFKLLLATSIGASLVGFVQAGAGAVLLTIQAVMRERVSVTQYGAKGDGTADDSNAIDAAIAYALTVGGIVFFPRGVYRVTRTINVGAAYFNDYAFIVNRAGSLDDSVYDDNTNAANKTANRLLKKVNVLGEAGAFLMGDFAPATPTPILAYNLDNDTSDTTGSVRGLSIVAANQIKAGKYVNAPYVANKLIGFATGRGAKVCEHLFVAGLGFGVVSARSYWCSFRDFDATDCGDAFHWSDANASDVTNMTAVRCARGYVYNAQNARFSGFNTENVEQDVWIMAADACTIGPAYLEDVRTNGGVGNYMMRFGTAAEGLQVTHSTITGILTLCVLGSKKKAFRLWSLADTTLNGCRAYGAGVDGDMGSYGTMNGCDFKAPNLTLSPAARTVSGTWAPAMYDSAGHAFVADKVVGAYTKIGNVVTAVCSFSWSSIGAADASPLILAGLPFPAKDVAALTQAATIGYASGFDAVANQIIAEISAPHLSYLAFKRINDNAPPASILANAQSQAGELHLSITYLTD